MRLAALLLLPLAACVPAAGPDRPRDGPSRPCARCSPSAFRVLPLEPATDCVIDNATGAEIISLASDAALGRPDEGTVETVLNDRHPARNDHLPGDRGSAGASETKLEQDGSADASQRTPG